MKLSSLLFALVFCFLNWTSPALAQGCHDPELRQKVTQVAQAEGVDEKELLSIIAHESGCRYYVIAWNVPKQPQTARSKFFNSLEEAKAFAEELIATGGYRVDVGIGQINNEAHIQPKGWVLEEVLDPNTALNRVARVLKERGWEHYHSNNQIYSEKWKRLAIKALNRNLLYSRSKTDIKIIGNKIDNIHTIDYKRVPLVIFNKLGANAKIIF